MKIAYLSTFYPFRGGIAQFNASLYKALEEENNQVKAFTFTRQYPDFLFPGKSQYLTENDKTTIIPSVQLLDSINPISYFKTAKAINVFSPDILIMKYWMSFFGPSLGTVAKLMRSKTKIITILDNVIPHEKRIIDTPFTNYFLNQNHGFIAMSKEVEAGLFSLKPNKPLLLMDHPLYNHFGDNIPPSQAKQLLKLDKSKKTILFFGFIRDYKGLDLLIEAFGNLDDSFQLVIAGESYASFDKYQQMVNNSVAKSCIHVHNKYIADEQVPYYFCAADVCVLPYKTATQSGITAIAHHFDLPIIATDVGGLKESVIANQNGLIVSNPTVLEITKAIKTYFNEEGLKNKFIKAIQKGKKENSWQNFAKQLVSFSKEI